MLNVAEMSKGAQRRSDPAARHIVGPDAAGAQVPPIARQTGPRNAAGEEHLRLTSLSISLAMEHWICEKVSFLKELVHSTFDIFTICEVLAFTYMVNLICNDIINT